MIATINLMFVHRSLCSYFVPELVPLLLDSFSNSRIFAVMASNVSGICSAASAKVSSLKATMASAIGSEVRRPEIYRPFPELAQGQDDVIKVLICRSWEARNPTGRYLGTEFIFSDEHGNAIHGIARSQIAHCVVSNLEIGQIYSIRRFTLQENKPTYHVRRDDKFLIQLEASTVIHKLDCSGTGFVQQAFHFKDIEEIAFNGNSYLIDVIGRVMNVDELRPTRNGSQYLELHLINERGRSIKVVLWGALGEDLIAKNCNSDDLYVIVLPAMKVVEYRGGVQLSSTSSTSIFDSQAIPEIAKLRKLLGNGAVLPPENNGTLIQLLQLGREQHGQANIASVTLKCQVSIVAIHPRSPWNYNSCGLKGCKKGVTPVGNQLWCESCGKPCEYPLLRYRLCLEVKDDTASLVVTLFDDEVESLMKKKATELMQAMEAKANEADYPEELLEVLGSSHLFELKSHTYYNHGQYESFTVNRVLSAPEKEKVSKRVSAGNLNVAPLIGTDVSASTKPGNMTTDTNIHAEEEVQKSENNSLPLKPDANDNYTSQNKHKKEGLRCCRR